MPVGTAQFGQADLSKTEAHAEAPMTQLERATVSQSSVIVGVIRNYPNRKRNEHNQIELRVFLIFNSANTFVAKPLRIAASIASIVDN